MKKTVVFLCILLMLLLLASCAPAQEVAPASSLRPLDVKALYGADAKPGDELTDPLGLMANGLLGKDIDTVITKLGLEEGQDYEKMEGYPETEETPANVVYKVFPPFSYIGMGAVEGDTWLEFGVNANTNKIFNIGYGFIWDMGSTAERMDDIEALFQEFTQRYGAPSRVYRTPVNVISDSQDISIEELYRGVQAEEKGSYFVQWKEDDIFIAMAIQLEPDNEWAIGTTSYADVVFRDERA